MSAVDLSKFTYDDFCKALYTCKTAHEVRALVEQDYGIKLAPKGSREDVLKQAYEEICKNKAPAASADTPLVLAAPVAVLVGAGKYKVRVKATGPDGRGRAGLRFGRRYEPFELTAEQATAIAKDPVLEMLPVEPEPEKAE